MLGEHEQKACKSRDYGYQSHNLYFSASNPSQEPFFLWLKTLQRLETAVTNLKIFQLPVVTFNTPLTQQTQ